MLEPFKRRRNTQIMEGLEKFRKGEEIGLKEIIDYMGTPPSVPPGDDGEGNPFFRYPDYDFRYNLKKERLEYYDTEKGKWRTVIFHKR